MGLFVTEDGHFQGWLAAFLCCCAAVTEDESPIEKDRERERSRRMSPYKLRTDYSSFNLTDQPAASTRTGLCNEQPLPLTALPSIPTAVPEPAFKGDEPVDVVVDEPRHTATVHERPPSLKPLDLGESSLLGHRSQHGRQKSSSGHSKRPSIGAPHAFRRLDHTEAQRQSLVPLRLGPVVLRGSPGPNDNSPTLRRSPNVVSRERSDSTQALLPDAAKSETSRTQRDTPFQRCQRRGSAMLATQQQDTPSESDRTSASLDERPSARPPVSTRSSSSSLRQSAVEASASSTLSKASSERIRLKRKRSLPSARKPYGESGELELDKEIMELNTIVEERRAETARDNSPGQHIPAVAPSMQVRARSETLDAIGSAFSRPATARDPRRTMSPFDTITDTPIRRTTSGAARASSRVSGWLSGVFPSASSGHLPGGDPFYKCQPQPLPLQLRRAHSSASLCTSVTEMDSPSLTVASSPTSKGHSRNQTNESRMTPLSPLPTVYGGHGEIDMKRERDVDDHWPIVMTPTSQVGLAL